MARGFQFPPATRPELKYEKGQPGTAPMWQWARQRPQATTPTSPSGQAARVWQQSWMICVLPHARCRHDCQPPQIGRDL